MANIQYNHDSLLMIGEHFFVVADVQSTCLVGYDEPGALETRTITVTYVS